MTAIRVELELADGSFTTKLLHAGQTVDSFAKSVAKTSPEMQKLADAGKPVIKNMQLSAEASRSFLSVLRDLSVVAGIFSYGLSKLTSLQDGWIGSIVKTNMEMERLNYQMQAMATSINPIKEAADSIEYLRQKSLEMPFAFNTITEAFVKMKATGTDPLNGSLQALADGVAAAGGDDEAMKRAVLAVSQISGKGVLQMEELRQQLGESMPQAAALMARSMGVSMSTLISEISTGTVQAKPALKALYDELDRTYGGRARMMMETFSGQVQRTRTLFQQLATDGTLKTNFYDGALREQIEDLNAFLSGRGASALRDDLGNALASLVRGFRMVVDAAVEFRGEIGRLAIVIGAAFSARAVGRGLTNIGELFDAITTKARLAAVQAKVTSGIFKEYKALEDVSGKGWERAQLRLAGNASALKTYLMGFAAWAPVITAVGFAIYGAAEYFGVFTDKAADAYEELKKFGAETKAQAEAIRDAKLKSLEEQVKAEEEARRKSLEGLKVDEKTRELVPDDTIGKLWTLKQEIAKVKDESKGLVQDAAEREATSAVERVTKALDRTLDASRVAYDQTMREVDERYNILEKKAAESGESVAAVTRQRARETYLIQAEFYEKQIAETQKAYEIQRGLAKNAAGDQDLKNANEAMIALGERLNQLNERKKALQEPTIIKMPAAPDEEKAFARGQELLKKMQAEAAGLQEELEGGYRTAAKLQKLLEQGKFGPSDKEEVKQLAELLIKQSERNEALREELRIQKEKTRVYDNGQDKANKLRAEIEGLRAELSGENGNLAELKEALALGDVGDIGEERVKKLIAELTQLMATRERLSAQAKRLRESNQLFENGQNNLRNITAEIEGMLGALSGVNEKVAEMNKLLASGKYGDQDQQRVMALRDALVDAIDAKEKLDKVMDGKRALENDIKAAWERVREEEASLRAEAEGRDLTEAEKIRLKLDNNGYPGLGNSEEAKNTIREVTQALQQAGLSSEALGELMRQNTFGDQSVAKINSLTDALYRVKAAIDVITKAAQGVSFDQFSLPNIISGMGSIATSIPQAVQSFTGAVSAAYEDIKGKANLMSKNMATFGNPYAPGFKEQNITNISTSSGKSVEVNKLAAPYFQGFLNELEGLGYKIKQIGGYSLRSKVSGKGISEHAFGNAIDINPDQNPYSKQFKTDLPANISQLAAKYGLSWGGDWKSIKDTMHFEWTGAQGEQRLKSYSETYMDLGQTIEQTNSQAEVSLGELEAAEKRVFKTKKENALKKDIEEIGASSKALGLDLDALGKNTRTVYENILGDKYAYGKDPRAKEYKEIIELAKKLDAQEEANSLKKKVRTDQEKAQLDDVLNKRRLAEREKQIKDPTYVPLSDEYLRKEQEYEQHLARMRQLGQQDTAAYRSMEEQKRSVLSSIRQRELAENQVGRAEKLRSAQMSYMTERQQAYAAMQQEIARIDAEVAAFQGSEQQKVEFVRVAEQQKAQIRQLYAQKMDPLGRQMQEWGDIQGNLAQASTRWMDSLAGGLTDLIMGTGDLRSAIQGILKDVVNMGIKYLMSGMMGGKSGGSAKSTAGKAGGFGSKLATGGKGKIPGAANGGLIRGLNYRKLLRGFDIGGYTGDGGKYEPAGIVHKGEYVMPKAATKAIGVENLRALHRRALNGRLAGDRAMLEGFAEGGLVGGAVARAQAPASVPSSKSVKEQGGRIAKSVGSGIKNEINVTNNINATGGTPQQNEDAAKKIAKEMEASMRNVVVDELQRQMRPGNILNNGRRR